jgi:hypothetical protein
MLYRFLVFGASWFPGSDKLFHIIFGAFASFIADFFTDNPALVFREAVNIGLAKELWDIGRSGKVAKENLLDQAFTMLGGLLYVAFRFYIL